MEHERLSRTYKDFTALQLERAQEDAHSAEDQLKSAEEYTCSIINTIRCLGFTIEFIDSDAVAVVKLHDSSMFPIILYGTLLTNVFIRNPYRLRVRFFRHIFATWLRHLYIVACFFFGALRIQIICYLLLFSLTDNQGRQIQIQVTLHK